MRSPALALGWELWAKNRLALSVMVLWAAVATYLVRILPPQQAGEYVALPTLLAASVAYVYLLWMFAHAESTLAGNGVGYPPRLFAMPVRTSLLVAWPMLYGMATMALVWLWLQLLVLYPANEKVSNWPALAFAASMAAFQALCWTVVRNPILRLALAVVGLPLVLLSDAYLWARYEVQFTPVRILTKSVVVIVVKYIVAVVGVSFDRRGERLDFSRFYDWISRVWSLSLGWRKWCRSPTRAQRWYELRRHGWIVPAMAALFVLMLYWSLVATRFQFDVAHDVLRIVVVPPFFAFFVGIGLGTTTFWGRDLRMSSYLATRPVSAAELARGKLDAAFTCAVRTWAYVAILTPAVSLAMINRNAMRELYASLLPDIPLGTFAWVASVGLAGLVGLAWLQLVAGTVTSICGRVWLLNGAALLYLFCGITAVTTIYRAIGMLAYRRADPMEAAFLEGALWGIAASLLFLKATGLAASLALHRHERTLPTLMVWLFVLNCLLVPVYVLIPAQPLPHLEPFPRGLLAAYLVLALPLNRPLLLPAAISWNRHT
jgi:hypothetical protein